MMKRFISVLSLSICLTFVKNVHAVDFDSWDMIFLAPQNENSGFNIYYNTRFGYAIEFPNDFGQKGDLPGNNDGITMVNGDAVLAMWGSYNVMEDTPESLFAYESDIEHVFDKVVTEDSLSYFRSVDNMEIYTYKKTGNVIVSFQIEFPEEQHDKYAGIISHMTDTVFIQ